ncbi:MAG: molecular chaperone TorD family protein [Acidobacteria bacterium]|nr:molecular chaperone TorD family protein [Acidobacteriota bacterium]
MTALDQPVTDLLRQAADWRLIGLLLECPRDGWREKVIALSAEVTDENLRRAASQALEEASEGLYHSTFGPGGPAPPREATHRDTVQLGYLMSELDAFYSAFGYQASTAEPPDHISVEAGFVAYLKFKEAYAISCGDEDGAAVSRDACHEFVSEHLASTAGPLTELLGTCEVPYLELLAIPLRQRSGEAKKRFVVLSPGDIEGRDEEFGCLPEVKFD